MSTELREFQDAQGRALVELAHDPRHGHCLAAMGLGQVQRSPSVSQGRRGREQGSRAPRCNARGRRAQQGGGAGRPCQVLAPTPGLELQAHQPALHIHLWLDHMKALPKGSASSNRAASDQGGPGAAGSSQGRKEGKYTLDVALDQPCKFHSTPGREATHSTR
jgi:hypothetical protein